MDVATIVQKSRGSSALRMWRSPAAWREPIYSSSAHFRPTTSLLELARRANSHVFVRLTLLQTIRSQIAELAYIQQMRDHRIGLDLAVRPKTPGLNAVGIFLFFGAIMASLAATTLLRRGTLLDHLWALNPKAFKQLAPLGGAVGILFLLLGAALATAGIGWFRRRLWGWRLAVVIIAIQVLGDVVNCVRGDLLRGGTGVIIAGALLLFLLQPKVRGAFA